MGLVEEEDGHGDNDDDDDDGDRMLRMVCARNTYNGGEDGDFDHDDDDHVERVVKFHVMEPE